MSLRHVALAAGLDRHRDILSEFEDSGVSIPFFQIQFFVLIQIDPEESRRDRTALGQFVLADFVIAVFVVGFQSFFE